jgi:hypothetical protein
MKISQFKFNRLDDFIEVKEKEVKDNPFLQVPFGLSRDGNQINAWQMNYNRIGIFSIYHGKKFFGKDDMILITVPVTETGLHPLAADQTFGWVGKINEYIAEMAVWWAFELQSDKEASEFMKAHKPVVEFSYFDSEGPGEMSVKYNGNFWQIIGW